MPVIPSIAQIPDQPFPVVAIGASMGGMAAIEELLRTLDTNTGMAFVIIMHVDANHKSVSPENIAKMTSMKVFEASEGMRLERNSIYVMPADVNLTVAGGILHSTVRTESPGQNKPIDRFFHTLASNSKSAAVGIVLSQGGSDGCEGCKSIVASGGHMFIQDSSTQAEHGGCDYFMGSSKELGRKLSQFSRNPESTQSSQNSAVALLRNF